MQGFEHKNPFFWGVILVQVQYLLLALGMTLKFYITVARVKTKSQNFLGVNSFVCRSYREKLAGGLFVPTPILNRVIIDACVVAFCVFFLKKKLLLNLRILFFTGACNISICDSVLKLRILKASVTYEILIYNCVQILFWKIKKSNKGW